MKLRFAEVIALIWAELRGAHFASVIKNEVACHEETRKTGVGPFDSAAAPLRVILLGQSVYQERPESAEADEDHERGPAGPSRMVEMRGPFGCDLRASLNSWLAMRSEATNGGHDT